MSSSTFQFVKSSSLPLLLLAPKSLENFCVSQTPPLINTSFRTKRRLTSLNTNTRLLLLITCSSKYQSNGEEASESLFMKELTRRGMTPTSSSLPLPLPLLKEDEISSHPRESDQREQSMALNSEGLEVLIPRATLLLTLGGTFFFAFRPLILLTVACFFAMYLFFGTKFVHDGTDYDTTIPQHMDPYQLVERKE